MLLLKRFFRPRLAWKDTGGTEYTIRWMMGQPPEVRRMLHIMYALPIGPSKDSVSGQMEILHYMGV